MAFFGVTLETLGKVRHHPNADRLDLAECDGMSFQFVVGRDQWKVGDRVLYFPVDSIFPEGLIDKLGLKGRLAGSAGNRLKTIKLREEVSQGLVADPVTVLGPSWAETTWTPESLTDFLGITKWEPPPNVTSDGILLPLPDGISMYDIEGADRYTGVIDYLMDQHVYVTEKIEGTNTWIVREIDGTFKVGQRSNLIEEDPSLPKPNVYWGTVRQQKVFDLMESLVPRFPRARLVLRGELVGPSAQNYYRTLNKNEIRFFDLQVSEKYVGPQTFEKCIPENQRVPTLALGCTLREWLNGRTVQEASNGMSLISPLQRREGIVIKPTTEQQMLDEIPGFRGRLLIKQRSPEYLAKES